MCTLIFIIALFNEPKVAFVPQLTEEECTTLAYILVNEQDVVATCEEQNPEV
jgi:hypothetical protein